MKRIALICTAVLLMGLACGCDSQDRVLYNTLSVSKAEIDQAASDERAGKLPQTACVVNLITKARAAQEAGKEAFLAYWLAEQVNADTTTLYAALNAALSDLATDIAAIKTLSSPNPNCGV